jgi:hypothetical protein
MKIVYLIDLIGCSQSNRTLNRWMNSRPVEGDEDGDNQGLMAAAKCAHSSPTRMALTYRSIVSKYMQLATESTEEHEKINAF